jgi:uncharacterized protein YceH (UPF0502 family)
MEPDAVEIRVVGCLIEKQRTTPDVYPLTLNALRLASGPGSRVAKYRQLLDDALGRVPSQVALLAVLMLRGPQTPGELKARVERLYPFGTLEDVQKALDALADAELVHVLPRRPGQSQDRWEQLLGGAQQAETASAPRGESVDPPHTPLEERVARLEEQVAALQRALQER